MLKNVIIQSSDPIVLPLEGASPDAQIVIKSITGLDPADVTLFLGEFARDGGYYQGRRASSRNPVMTLKINPDYTNDVSVSDIREQLYSAILEPNSLSLSSDNVDGIYVTLEDDRKPDRYFVGYAEKTLSDIFSKETSMQISMVCPDPYLYSVVETSASDVLGWTTIPVEYDGSARTGLEMVFEVNTAVAQLSVSINGISMLLERAFVDGDVVTINTVIGSRSIRVNGVDIMASLSPASKWLQLNKGTNTIITGGADPGDGSVSLIEYTYRSAWWGI